MSIDFRLNMLSQIAELHKLNSITSSRALTSVEYADYYRLKEDLAPYNTTGFLLDEIRALKIQVEKANAKTLQGLITALNRIQNSKEFSYLSQVVERAKTYDYIKELKGEI